MGHVNSLTDHKKGMIDAFEKDGPSQREIAKKINRSRCAVNYYIKNKNKTPKKIPGRPEKLSPRNRRDIIRDVRKSGKSVSQIQLPGDINISRWTIWRTWKNCPNVEYSIYIEYELNMNWHDRRKKNKIKKNPNCHFRATSTLAFFKNAFFLSLGRPNSSGTHRDHLNSIFFCRL